MDLSGKAAGMSSEQQRRSHRSPRLTTTDTEEEQSVATVGRLATLLIGELIVTEIQDFGRQLSEFARGLLGSSGGSGEGEVFESDANAELEIRGFLADLQVAYSRGDIDYIVNTIADEFTTYELVAVNGRPLKVTGRENMRTYLSTLFPTSTDTQVKTIFATQAIATPTLGLVNEEGDVIITRADHKEHQPLYSSALAVKTADGWKWRHWHMSEAGPRFRVNLGGQPIDDNGRVIPGARVVVENGLGRVVVDGQNDGGTAPRD
ncbi:SnoaL-like domain-containing protein [Lentzea albidocapillata]|uniref:SnoaL-like domain-containing protein n=1 Tax=Lentzea albidocapillata TaxID=40571 RepID=A0A1W1ZUK6_9PSEU|nr:SnoaL-like domain-containing protein [Lentzea albidocapillata]